MKPDRRMNLFRELTEQKAQSFKMPKLQLGFQGWAVVVTFVLFGLSTNSKYRKFNADAEGLDKRKAEIEGEIEKLVQESGKVAAEDQKFRIEQAKAKKESVETARVVSSTTSEIDGTWTSLMWKLTTHASDIVMGNIDLGARDPNATTVNVNAKYLIIDGRARSMNALSRWLEYLTVHLPTASINLEKEGLSNDKEFPVVFRINARVIL